MIDLADRLRQTESDVFVVGPTGVGKSSLAADLAAEIDADIIGLDAFQIYEGMAILTAQPPADLRARVRHHLIGEISPATPFSAGQFAERVLIIRKKLRASGRNIVFCGGTGLYLRALTTGLPSIPPTPPSIRETLASLPLDELQRRLNEADPAARSRIDFQNPRRVQRALEIVVATGKTLAQAWACQPPADGSIRGIGVICLREPTDLLARIEANVRAQFAAGVVEEVARLGPVGSTASHAIGFQAIRDVIERRITQDAAIELMILRSRQYAKRQLTWFRGQTKFPLLNLTPTETGCSALSTAKLLLARQIQ